MRRTAAFGGSGTDTGGGGAGSAARAGLDARTLSGLLSGRKAGFSTLTVGSVILATVLVPIINGL